MNDLAPMRARDWLALAVVSIAALGLRAGYLYECAGRGEANPAWQVQGELHDESAELLANLRDANWFAARAPLARAVEDTAHVEPGYLFLVAWLSRFDWDAFSVVRWSQTVLGALTAALYFLVGRRAFRSVGVGFIAGLLAALHPYWVLNVAEVADGGLAAFLLAAALCLGLRGAEVGGAFTSLLFGAALAGLCLVRAAMLPFALIGLVWFLLRCRTTPQGWLCALLAFLGFGNGLAPWMVRNMQAFGEPLPIVSSAWLHLWKSVAPVGRPDHDDLGLAPERKAALMKETNQARRYDMLAREVVGELSDYPGSYLTRRLEASVVFLFGEPWLRDGSLARKANAALESGVAEPPEWLSPIVPGLLAASLVLMIGLGLWGWRQSLGWQRSALLTIAALLVPLPYLLSHAGFLVGPRLPVDGVWLVYAAAGLVSALGLRSAASQDEV